ncbi:hypothetical protein C2845_PM03G12630 [Panicum miliaceum]|uniref:DC1 domain-containing protein n=1 Tax=Panicum miliaceum TaxID=4540 RepID=A0A3L6TDJ8_PANMI|nr:hypothetical protein C2845_PM03G12630 [Panicum miliaceum]
MAEAYGSISHFSHPGHELVKRQCATTRGPSFLCDMCWEDLSGLAYGCRAGCNFAIHDACAGHPQTLVSPAHHLHQLVLVRTRRDVAQCCAGPCAPGCFLYRCPPCGFDICTRGARGCPSPCAARDATWRTTSRSSSTRDAAPRATTGGGGGVVLPLHGVVQPRLPRLVRRRWGGGRWSSPRWKRAWPRCIPPDINGELLRARIQAQSDMAFAFIMANASANLAKYHTSRFY